MQKIFDEITILILFTIFLIMLMALLIISLIYIYNKKQLKLQEKIIELQENYEKNILQTKLEIQEQTSEHIAREIHDNINLSLTLAKLNLHTADLSDIGKTQEKIDSSVQLLTHSITELSDISKSLNGNVIIQQGLLKALDEEIHRISKTGVLKIEYSISGEPVYMDAQKELIIYRIIQEAFNNIIKHARADTARLILLFNSSDLQITVKDNGIGFDKDFAWNGGQAGLKNMDTRVKILNGTMKIETTPGVGTSLYFNIPST